MTAGRRSVRWLTFGIVVAGALAVLGLIAFWPRGDAPELAPQPNTYVDATVTGIDEQTCDDFDTGATTPCQIVSAELTSGARDGDVIQFQVRSTQFEVPELHDGDDVVLLDVATSPAEFRYSWVDFQRGLPLMWLVGGFALVVIAFGRFQGVRALVGLAASGVVLVAFIVPALLRDEPALPVALAGAVAIAFVALYLAHGIKIGTTVALGGTLVSLAITTGLAMLMVTATQLTGLADQNAQVLRVTADAIDLRGLLVAGIVVGALGVLDDVTVSQVSIVAALRRANPGLPRRMLYREATRVGRDHVASTVNTLVLAYAGASLPLLLFFAQGTQPVERLITGELISVEIVRMLVGSIGIVASVPITTALAAAVLGVDDEVHGHAHGPGPEDRDRPGRPRRIRRSRPQDRVPVGPAPPGAGQQGAPSPWDDFAPQPDDQFWGRG
jgi:uncharacterized membrane protein